jgi:hypothetical protein
MPRNDVPRFNITRASANLIRVNPSRVFVVTNSEASQRGAVACSPLPHQGARVRIRRFEGLCSSIEQAREAARSK